MTKGHYVLAPNAELDLVDIWEFGVERWGVDQADAYLLSIEQGLDRLAGSPLIGRARDEIRPGFRSFRHRSHTIFYRLADDCIEVLGLVRAGMDIERYFDQRR